MKITLQIQKYLLVIVYCCVSLLISNYNMFDIDRLFSENTYLQSANSSNVSKVTSTRKKLSSQT